MPQPITGVDLQASNPLGGGADDSAALGLGGNSCNGRNTATTIASRRCSTMRTDTLMSYALRGE
jgi:hypothetical protein